MSACDFVVRPVSAQQIRDCLQNGFIFSRDLESVRDKLDRSSSIRAAELVDTAVITVVAGGRSWQNKDHISCSRRDQVD